MECVPRNRSTHRLRVVTSDWVISLDGAIIHTLTNFGAVREVINHLPYVDDSGTQGLTTRVISTLCRVNLGQTITVDLIGQRYR
jgi:hypothetical protein